MVKLPVYKGYTYDFRCQEIRRFELDEPAEIIPFESKRGIAMLDEFFDADTAIDEFDRYDEECQANGYPRPRLPKWFVDHRRAYIASKREADPQH